MLTGGNRRPGLDLGGGGSREGALEPFTRTSAEDAQSHALRLDSLRVHEGNRQR